MVWLEKTGGQRRKGGESFSAPEESASLFSSQDVASTIPPKISGVSPGHVGVGLGQLFGAQRVPALVSKGVRTPRSACPPWGSRLDLRRCQALRCRDPALALVLLDLSPTFLSPLGTGSLLFCMWVLM